MEITFGWYLDGPTAPDLLGGREACAGEVVAGPAGLVGLLEARMGLGGLVSTPPVRTAQYAARLEKMDDGGRFYSQSRKRDLLGTARVLLQWRDELIGGGWDGQELSGGGERLADLARVESAEGPLAAGFEERVRRLSAAMRGRGAVVDRLRLVDRQSLLSPAVRALVAALGAEGTRVEARVGEPANSLPGSDLAGLKAGLSGAPSSKRGDGSVVRIVADSDTEAAQAVASWLEESGREACVVLPAGDDLLDRAMTRRGMPATGTAPISPWRPALQVLPLLVASRWRPFDPQRLHELLLLPGGPVPAFAASRLAEALTQSPGIGGPVWERALESVAAARKSPERRSSPLLARWLPTSALDNETGAPLAELLKLCRQIASWAAGRQASGRGDPALAAAIGLAKEVEMLLGHIGSDCVSRILWESTHDAAAGVGVELPGPPAARGHIPIVRHPGAILGPVGSLVWWDFTRASAVPVRRSPWEPGERAVLARIGVELESPREIAEREAEAFTRAVASARERLILVQPRRRLGRATEPHPELARLAAAMGGPVTGWTADALAWASAQRLTGSFRRRPLRPPDRWWRLPAGCRLPPRAVESYSSLEKLLERPHAWVLEYIARLTPGSSKALPEPAKLLGTLSHRLVQECLQWLGNPSRAQGKDLVEDWVRRRLPELLAKEGATLLRPGFEPDIESLRVNSIHSVRALAAMMAAGGWRLEGCEVRKRGEFLGAELEGSLDLVLSSPGGERAVLDLKWGSRSWRAREIREGVPLQLLLYGRLLWAEDTAWPRLGFFILRQSEFLPADLLQPDSTGLAGAFDIESEWERLAALVRWRRTQLERGLVEVVAPGTEPDEASSPPGIELVPGEIVTDEYSFLTGWRETAGPARATNRRSVEASTGASSERPALDKAPSRPRKPGGRHR